MSNDFDYEPEWDLGEELDDELAEFDEFDDDLDDVEMRTAVMQKNNMIALLCIKTASAGAAICRVDPREERPAVQIYDDADAAVEWFSRSLRTSKKNGWSVIYDGLPLQG
jgi:hypothetical protein